MTSNLSKRIGLIGFQHETNTFANSVANLDDFKGADAWPGLCKGAAILEAVRGPNLPAAGFLEASRQEDWEIIPILWCSAAPSGPVTKRTFEGIVKCIMDRVIEAGPLDALYLDLHGAMVCAHLDDGEGELLRRLRCLLGEDVRIVCSLDFHANVSQAMCDLADCLVAYRTYPHVDMAETGRRAAGHLSRLLRGRRYQKAITRISYLIPLVGQYSDGPPMRDVYEQIQALEAREDINLITFTPGFPLADVENAGPVVVVYGGDEAACQAATQQLWAFIENQKAAFQVRLYPPQEAVEQAISLSQDTTAPVLLADTQDNPGCGGRSDTVGLLRELIRQQAQGVVLGLLYDPQAARLAHEIGEGGAADFSLGAATGYGEETPVVGRFVVDKVGTGKFTGTGPFYHGCRMDLGPMACLRQKDIRVIISSKRQQAADQAMFRHMGIEPRDQKILALKSSVHFRADFGPIAGNILIVESPGENTADLTKLEYLKCRLSL